MKSEKDLSIALKKIQREVNWIIIEAIKEYLFKINSNFFIEEARRQSLSVSRHSEPSDDIWEDNIDDSEWKEFRKISVMN
jgi:hypothetical protein